LPVLSVRGKKKKVERVPNRPFGSAFCPLSALHGGKGAYGYASNNTPPLSLAEQLRPCRLQHK
ncbi:hypothetical protein, partial [Escherichia coli]|uniref:hypothetical protein n=1 Tax=Escherichia coli TaxID=562 RepID=UPI00195381BC